MKQKTEIQWKSQFFKKTNNIGQLVARLIKIKAKKKKKCWNASEMKKIREHYFF